MKRIAVVAVLVVLVAAVAMRRGGESAGGTSATVAETRKMPVGVTPVRAMTFERVLRASGNIEAKDTALVSPRVGGTIDAVYVDEGDRVEAGVTKLFQIDAVKLQKAVEIAAQDHAVALCSVQEKVANLDKAEADFKKARLDYERAKTLLAQNVVSQASYDAAESAFRQSEAGTRYATVVVELAREQEKQSKLRLDVAQKDWRDSLALAPLSGVVSSRLKEPGEMGTVGTPVVAIEDTSKLEASAFMPEEFYALVIPGKTPLRMRVGDADLGTGPLAYRGPTIQKTLRTFEIKSPLATVPAGVAPGRIVQMELVIETRAGLGVPRDAVQQRGDAWVIFVAANGVAKMVTVCPGLETDGWVELLPGAGTDAPVAEGASVITQGQRFVNDAMPVELVGAQEKPGEGR